MLFSSWHKKPDYIPTQYTLYLHVVEIPLDLQVLVYVGPTHALRLYHPALDTPRIVCPAVDAIFAHLHTAAFRVHNR